MPIVGRIEFDAREAHREAERLRQVVDRLTAIVDRQTQERERIRLALRLILTVPMREWVGPVLAEAQRMNPDVV